MCRGVEIRARHPSVRARYVRPPCECAYEYSDTSQERITDAECASEGRRTVHAEDSLIVKVQSLLDHSRVLQYSRSLLRARLVQCSTIFRAAWGVVAWLGGGLAQPPCGPTEVPRNPGGDRRARGGRAGPARPATLGEPELLPHRRRGTPALGCRIAAHRTKTSQNVVEDPELHQVLRIALFNTVLKHRLYCA